MKTNAKKETVVAAVNSVSSKLYGGNVIFRKEPENITKNVIRFTLKTKDANAPGSIVTKNGQKHPKANWKVHLEVIAEIFRIEPRKNLYVDTIAGRMYRDNIPEGAYMEETNELEKFKESLKFIVQHPELLEKVF